MTATCTFDVLSSLDGYGAAGAAGLVDHVQVTLLPVITVTGRQERS